MVCRTFRLMPMLVAVTLMVAVVPVLARNRLMNSEFDSNGGGNAFPTNYQVYPAPPSPLPLAYPLCVYNKCQPGNQLLLQMRHHMTNRMYGGVFLGAELPDYRSSYLYQTYTLSDLKDPFPPYKYYASACVLTFAQAGDPAACKVRVGVGKNMGASPNPLDPSIVWSPYTSTQGYPWTRTDPVEVVGDRIGDQITVFINFEIPTNDSDDLYNCALVDSIWLNTEPFPKIQNIKVEPANEDCTDWTFTWDTVEPGNTMLYYRRFKQPNIFGPTYYWAHGGDGTVVRIGVDPTGGTDPASASIAWSGWTPVSDTRWIEIPSGWTDATVSDYTAFIEARNPLGDSYSVWIDDVVAWDDDALVNLGLVNGNFEGGFVNDPDSSHQTPNGWTKYVLGGAATTTDDTATCRSGAHSWKLSGGNWTTGIYQRGTGAVVGRELSVSAMVRGDYPTDTTKHSVTVSGLDADPDFDGWEFECKTNEHWYMQGSGAIPGVIYTKAGVKTPRIISGPMVDPYTATITWETDIPSTTEVAFNHKGAGDLAASPFVYRDHELVTHHAAPLNDWSKAPLDPLFRIQPGETVYWHAMSGTIPDVATRLGYVHSTYSGLKDLATDKFQWGGGPEYTGSIGGLKRQANGTVATYTGKVVTGSFYSTSNFSYIEEPDRTSGIRVAWDVSLSRGDLVDIKGLLQTLNGEKQIVASELNVTATEQTVPAPVAMTNKTIAAVGQGAQARGLLVTMCGRVTWVDFGNGCFYLDDGSGYRDGTVHDAGTGPEPNVGIRVYGLSSFWESPYVVVRKGCVGTATDGETIVPAVWVMYPEDIEVVPE